MAVVHAVTADTTGRSPALEKFLLRLGPKSHELVQDLPHAKLNDSQLGDLSGPDHFINNCRKDPGKLVALLLYYRKISIEIHHQGFHIFEMPLQPGQSTPVRNIIRSAASQYRFPRLQNPVLAVYIPVSLP